ncbi:MAG: RpiB/LacA/LacB family sugar-phosphate isomerase [Acetivibrionales bacterium]|jgi:ribose 5-phosphate isomerase B
MDKKIVISSDPAGFELKENIKEYLQEKGYEVTDVGTTDLEKPVYYYEAAENISREVQKGNFQRGIVVCGTGMGVAQVCNKFKGIFCALVESEYAARKCRIVNNSNILALGGFILTPTVAREIVDIFLNTEWCQGEPPHRVEFLKGLRAQCDGFGQEL